MFEKKYHLQDDIRLAEAAGLGDQCVICTVVGKRADGYAVCDLTADRKHAAGQALQNCSYHISAEYAERRQGSFS